MTSEPMHNLLAALPRGIINPVLPNPVGGGGGVVQNPEAGSQGVARFIESIMSFGLIFAFLLLMIYLVTGGIAWITANGDKAGLEAARNKITHAVIGIVVVAAAWAIALLVGGFIGLDIQKLPIPSLAD